MYFKTAAPLFVININLAAAWKKKNPPEDRDQRVLVPLSADPKSMST